MSERYIGTTTLRDLAHYDGILACDDPEVNDLLQAHEGEIVDGRRLVCLGPSDDGEDLIWQFIRTDGPR